MILEDEHTIFQFTGPYRFLSNFYSAQVMYMGFLFPTVEHAYQAAKNPTKEHFVRILSAGPAEAKRVGRQCALRDGWDERKIVVMRDLLKQKFESPFLAQLLRNTRPKTLIEGNWWGDRFWGVCRGEGENMLGKLLMEVREEI